MRRRLRDLDSVGPATLDDLARLGIRTVSSLARARPENLYERLCALEGRSVDICVLDVLRCAHAQAVDPELPSERRTWWYWSRRRKSAAGASPDR